VKISCVATVPLKFNDMPDLKKWRICQSKIAESRLLLFRFSINNDFIRKKYYLNYTISRRLYSGFLKIKVI
jgi:hypothetical protein